MQTTDCKQGTKCSVYSTDMVGTKSLDCDKNSWKQILVTKCEDAGFIFYFGKIKVNKCHATNKKQKGIDTVLGHMIFGTLLYVLYWLFFLFFPVFYCFLFNNNNNNNNNNNIFNQGKPMSWSCYKWVPCIFSSYLKWQPNF